MVNLTYKLYFALLWLITLPPLAVLYAFSDLLYLLMFYAVGYRKKTVYGNLKNAFPEKSEPEIDEIARSFYRHLCDTFIESVKMMHMSYRQMERRFKYVNPELLDELFDKGKHVVLLSGHNGNWEWTNYFTRHIKHKMLVIYHILRNPFSEKLVKYLRSRNGLILVPMGEIFRRIMQEKKNGNVTLTWFLADQRPPKSNKFRTSFLNQDTSFYQGGEKIAKKLDAAVVFMDIQKVKRGHYKVIFKTLFENPKETAEGEITEKYAQTLEEVIIQKPDYWLWSHKRWKHKKPTTA